MPQTVVEKIAQKHLAEGPNRPLRSGDFLSIRPFHVMTHDNTSAVMSKFKGIGGKKIHDPKQLVFALDHDIQNQDESNLKTTRCNTERPFENFNFSVSAAEFNDEIAPLFRGESHVLALTR